MVMGFQYHTVLVESTQKNQGQVRPPSTILLDTPPNFIQSAWALLLPDAPISKKQADIVSSGSITTFIGLLLLLLGPMWARHLAKHWDL